jgi:mannose/fructose/N-acetylgalactosamine-specific phosphotransferase system component IIC
MMCPTDLITALPLWNTISLIVLCAVLTLDVTSYAQTWLSQPLPAGIFAGLICGDVTTGFAVALPVQLLSISNLPVGRSCSGERTSGIIISVLVLSSIGYKLPLVLVDSMTENIAMLGWIVTAVCLGSFVGGWMIKIERFLHYRLLVQGIKRLRTGTVSELDEIQKKCMLITASRGIIASLLWILFLTLIWVPIFYKLSSGITGIFKLIPLLAISLGTCSLIELYVWRRGWLWLVSGSVGTAILLLVLDGAI